MKSAYPHIARIKTIEEFRKYLGATQAAIPVDPEVEPAPTGSLAQPYVFKDGKVIGNRFCIQPMEGWDASPDGNPTELVVRRWRNFGLSGAKLIWGGEATAVLPEGRANPNQLILRDENMQAIENLRLALVTEHRLHFGQTDDLLVGLQLTHSGRFCKPNLKTKLEPKILYHHPVLDPIFHIAPDYRLCPGCQACPGDWV
jgi:2,4-dienoyl-CoA reductase-like NADH-dependent reductase (Old Yellow Enzyme family)